MSAEIVKLSTEIVEKILEDVPELRGKMTKKDIETIVEHAAAIFEILEKKIGKLPEGIIASLLAGLSKKYQPLRM